MVSQGISFSISPERLTALEKHQKLRKRLSVSTDVFAKELLHEKLDELDAALGKATPTG